MLISSNHWIKVRFKHRREKAERWTRTCRSYQADNRFLQRTFSSADRWLMFRKSRLKAKQISFSSKMVTSSTLTWRVKRQFLSCLNLLPQSFLVLEYDGIIKSRSFNMSDQLVSDEGRSIRCSTCLSYKLHFVLKTRRNKVLCPKKLKEFMLVNIKMNVLMRKVGNLMCCEYHNDHYHLMQHVLQVFQVPLDKHASVCSCRSSVSVRQINKYNNLKWGLLLTELQVTVRWRLNLFICSCFVAVLS